MANNIINNGKELENLKDKLEIETGKGIIFRYDTSFEKDSSYPVYWRKCGKHYLIYKKLTPVYT